VLHQLRAPQFASAEFDARPERCERSPDSRSAVGERSAQFSAGQRPRVQFKVQLRSI